MFYEVSSRRVVIDKKGNDKNITEQYVVEGAELFGEAETALLLEFLSENDVVAIKRSNIASFLNGRTSDDDSIYIATVEVVNVADDGKEFTTRETVGLFSSKGIQDATEQALSYVAGFISDATLVGVRKSKFVDKIKYLK